MSRVKRNDDLSVESIIPAELDDAAVSGCHVDSNGDDYEINLSSLNPVSLMTVPLRISSETYNGLIDSGASFSLVKLSVICTTESLVPVGTNRVVTGLGGSTISPYGLVSLSFQIESLVFHENFVGVPDRAIKHSVILGNSFFTANRILVDFAGSKLSGSICDGRWELYIDGPSTCMFYRDLKLCLAEDAHVVVSNPVLLHVVVGGDRACDSSVKDMYYDGAFSNRYRDVIIGKSGIVDITNGYTDVIIEKLPDNKHNKELLKKGTVVGTVSSIFDVENFDVNVSDTVNEQAVLLELISSIKTDNLSPDQINQAKDMLR